MLEYVILTATFIAVLAGASLAIRSIMLRREVDARLAESAISHPGEISISEAAIADLSDAANQADGGCYQGWRSRARRWGPGTVRRV